MSGGHGAAMLPSKRGRLSELILGAARLAPGRKGASLPFIKKVLAAEGYDVERKGGRLKAALNALLDKGFLRRVTGSGVAGSFRVGKERAEKSGRAAGETRRRRRSGKEEGKKRRRRKRVVRAGAQRLKKARRPRGKIATEEVEETGDTAAVAGEF